MPKTFKDFDKLGFNAFALRLSSFIQTDRHFVEGALLVSLNGRFGCGKSTFFEMWREQLEAETSKRFSTIPLNAWDADFERDPLLSIVCGFIRHFESKGKKLDADSLKESAGKLGRFALTLGNDVVAKFTGLDIQKAGEAAEPQSPGITGKACFEVFEERNEVFMKLKGLLTTAVQEEEKPIIIMVDELDRCRPDHAVEYLETIKHIFDIEGLVFVLGIDKVTLTSSVRSLFGADLNFDEYYRKFVHRNVTFPTPDKNTLHRFSADLVEHYLMSEALTESGRNCFAEWDHSRVENLAELFGDFSLSPRQIHEVFRLLAHCLDCADSQASRMLWGWQIGTIFLATLSVAKSDVSRSFGSGTISPEMIVDLLQGCSEIMEGERTGAWWSALISLGAFGADEEGQRKFVVILKGLRLVDDEYSEESAKKHLQEMTRAYDRFGMGRGGKMPFQEIYDQLEGVRQFGRD